MKKHLPIALLFILVLACSLPSALTPTVATQPPVPPGATVTAPPVLPATDTSVPATATPALPSTNVTCHALSFHLDPLVAFGHTCAVVPEQTQGIGVHPEYTQVVLTTYQTGSSVTPEIDVFPVQGFSAIDPGGVSSFQSSVQALVGGAAPGKTLPYLNPHESAQEFYADYLVVHGAGGSGIRYLTQYVQNIWPVNNQDMFYTFQGVSGDGQYFITAILPVSSPVLPHNGDTFPGGETFDQFSATFDQYIAGVKTSLEAQPPDTFAPTLTLLDDLVKSIQVAP